MTISQPLRRINDSVDDVSLTYLNVLNGAQREAVEALDGPVLVLAGAGTGKTRVLTMRIVHLLKLGKAWPSQILAVTFTNKAAFEMKERIGREIGAAVEGLWLGTFHSICVKILRRHAELAGLKQNFTILDADDQLRLIKQLVKAEDLDDKKHPPRLILSVISRWKDRGLTPDKVPPSDLRGGTGGEEDPALKIYKIYQERLQVLNAVDFGDLLLLTVRLFSEHGEILKHYQTQFRYILVDEYQDTNVVQYLWLRLLAKRDHQNICCVGDDDQSIYGWRGAEVGNILRFEQDFQGARVIRLEQNYRSTPHILAAASALIAHNKGRLGKSLWTESNSGERVMVRGLWDGEEEARFVGEEIELLQRACKNLSSMAILVRAGYQTREFEDRLMTLGIPYKVIGGLRFYERQEVRDALAYLRLVAQPDDSLAFERIINVPKRGIGDATLQVLHAYARSQMISLPQAAIALLETDELRGKVRETLTVFFRDVARWRSLLQVRPPREVVEIVLDESGYTGMWMQDKNPEAPGRLENLKEFVTALEEFNSLDDFLEHVSLVMENTAGSQEDMISMMTLHSAKGLEFETVFLAGWEEGVFPSPRSLEESGTAALEEERRLAYVGLTRAKERAIISYAVNRRIHGTWQTSIPSRFIDELSKDHIEMQTPTSIFSTRQSARGSLEESGYTRRYLSGPRRPQNSESRISSASSSSNVHLGERVFHTKFGYGKIVAQSGEKLDVLFDHSGLKKVMAAFVQKA